jgi:hypothetical protein
MHDKWREMVDCYVQNNNLEIIGAWPPTKSPNEVKDNSSVILVGLLKPKASHGNSEV